MRIVGNSCFEVNRLRASCSDMLEYDLERCVVGFFWSHIGFQQPSDDVMVMVALKCLYITACGRVNLCKRATIFKQEDFSFPLLHTSTCVHGA